MGISDQDHRQAVGRRVREARMLAGLSQGQLAKFMGLHRPAISEIEAGNRNVKADELAKLSEFLDVSVEFLTGATTPSSAHDERVQLAAREFQKLSPEALESLLKAMAAFRQSPIKQADDE